MVTLAGRCLAVGATRSVSQVANFTSLPMIDMGPLVQRKEDPRMQEDAQVEDVIQQLGRACREIGFFYVKGHGVPPHLPDSVLEVSREFFNLPTEEKLRIGMNRSVSVRGYQKLGENITKGRPDLHEAIDVLTILYHILRSLNLADLKTLSGNPFNGQNPWPDQPTRFRPLMDEYVEVMKDLGKTIMQGIALALGGPKDMFEGGRAGNPFWIMRVIGYPPTSNFDHAREEKFSEIGCGEHTDYGLLTLVNQDADVPALQVKNQGGEWIWAHPIPGTFVVNIGDMLKIWTNGLYQPTVHRVINNNFKYRVSVPFFYEPNFDAVVEPLELCKQHMGRGGPSFAPVVYGDHVTSKVLTNFG